MVSDVTAERHVRLISKPQLISLMDERETVQTETDSFDSTGGGCVSGGESCNPFLFSRELTTRATELATGGAAGSWRRAESAPQQPSFSKLCGGDCMDSSHDE